MLLKLNEKKESFFFYEKKAILIFTKRHSNYFFTLLDLKKKVVCCKTSGCNSFLKNKKKKMSFQAIEAIINLFEPVFRLYDINKLDIIFKDLPSALYYVIVNNLELKGIDILDVKMSFRSSHNGVKGRRIRRV